MSNKKEPPEGPNQPQDHNQLQGPSRLAPESICNTIMMDDCKDIDPRPNQFRSMFTEGRHAPIMLTFPWEWYRKDRGQGAKSNHSQLCAALTLDKTTVEHDLGPDTNTRGDSDPVTEVQPVAAVLHTSTARNSVLALPKVVRTGRAHTGRVTLPFALATMPPSSRLEGECATLVKVLAAFGCLVAAIMAFVPFAFPDGQWALASIKLTCVRDTQTFTQTTDIECGWSTCTLENANALIPKMSISIDAVCLLPDGTNPLASTSGMVQALLAVGGAAVVLALLLGCCGGVDWVIGARVFCCIVATALLVACVGGYLSRCTSCMDGLAPVFLASVGNRADCTVEWSLSMLEGLGLTCAAGVLAFVMACVVVSSYYCECARLQSASCGDLESASCCDINEEAPSNTHVLLSDSSIQRERRDVACRSVCSKCAAPTLGAFCSACGGASQKERRTVCANCNAPLSGAFCSACGTKN